MTRFSRWFVISIIKILFPLFIRIERSDLAKVPSTGPLILAINHINSLEVPLLLAYLQPRQMVALAKIETWDNKVMGWLFDLWNSIPIRRGEVDLDAVRRCLAVLAARNILVIAPEGTRSYDGKLLQGQPGVVLVALRSGAPILPVVHWGGEDFPQNIKHLKRTNFQVRVGKPFTLDARGEKLKGPIRQEMVDEIMCELAKLMPEEYRGQYANCAKSPQKYLRYLEGYPEPTPTSWESGNKNRLQSPA
jgi:1-acyl-sn-glycerol-3-phosphate acyltransferase